MQVLMCVSTVHPNVVLSVQAMCAGSSVQLAVVGTDLLSTCLTGATRLDMCDTFVLQSECK